MMGSMGLDQVHMKSDAMGRMFCFMAPFIVITTLQHIKPLPQISQA
jgi:hypothetical protein